MIIPYELVDSIEAIRIKVVALYGEVSFDRFSTELRFDCGCLGDFVIMPQCCIIALILWLEKFLVLSQDSLWLVSELMELQNFSQLAFVPS